MFSNEVEDIIEPVFEYLSVTNASKDFQVVIASLSSYDAPLINFTDVSLKTQESSFQEFSGNLNNLKVSEEMVIPLGSDITQVEDKNDNQNPHPQTKR